MSADVKVPRDDDRLPERPADSPTDPALEGPDPTEPPGHEPVDDDGSTAPEGETEP